MLTQETIDSLYARPATLKAAQATPRGRAFTTSGWQDLTSTSNAVLGAFEGNVGTTRRSRSGRTARLANGRRYYCPPESAVLAYKLN